jgi:endonuclease III
VRSQRGIGPKTVDYLSVLSGRAEAIAVDRHLWQFVARSGSDASTYEAVSTALLASAKTLGLAPTTLDAALWSALSPSMTVMSAPTAR